MTDYSSTLHDLSPLAYFQYCWVKYYKNTTSHQYKITYIKRCHCNFYMFLTGIGQKWDWGWHAHPLTPGWPIPSVYYTLHSFTCMPFVTHTVLQTIFTVLCHREQMYESVWCKAWMACKDSRCIELWACPTQINSKGQYKVSRTYYNVLYLHICSSSGT